MRLAKIRRISTVEQMLARIEENSIVNSSGCKIWMGARSDCGYAVARFKGKLIALHRFVCEQAYGPLKGRNANHHCDVPYCLESTHIYPGTQTQNIKDWWLRKRRADWQNRKEEQKQLLSELLDDAW